MNQKAIAVGVALALALVAAGAFASQGRSAGGRKVAPVNAPAAARPTAGTAVAARPAPKPLYIDRGVVEIRDLRQPTSAAAGGAPEASGARGSGVAAAA
jgi:hypothetical protein